MIVPGAARLAFKITLNSTDASRTLVQNIGRAIVNSIRISGNEVLVLRILTSSTAILISRRQRKKEEIVITIIISIYQNTDTCHSVSSRCRNRNCIAADKAIIDAYSHRFYTPSRFPMFPGPQGLCVISYY